MNDKQLYEIWEKYIDVPIYRVISEEYLADIKKNGLNPEKNPFNKIKPKLEKLFKLILKLEKQGRIFQLDWWSKIVTGSYAVKVTRHDLDYDFIDFTPSYKDAIKYTKQFQGGGVVTNTKDCCKAILRLDVELDKKDKELINFLLKWASKKSKYKNRILAIKGSSKSFENAKFQHFLGTKPRYWDSPYGSFEHFKKVVKKNGIERYLPFLKQEITGYPRVKDKIPASEIEVIR